MHNQLMIKYIRPCACFSAIFVQVVHSPYLSFSSKNRRFYLLGRISYDKQERLAIFVLSTSIILEKRK
ncbi:MAG: hypothetical protein C5B59_11435 [Bacteroidetes bacterium]|nr:MAG: hypothetical protein C5B59_11435 [Bacteroidota bacterium]